MTDASQEIRSLLGCGRELTQAAERTAGNPNQRATEWAKVLHACWSAPVYACLVRAEDESFFAVLDKEGMPRPDWESRLRLELERWSERSRADKTRDAALPRALGMPGYRLAVEPVDYRGRSYGLLAVALHSGDADPDALPRATLAHAAEHLALVLYAEEQERLRRPAPPDADRLAGLNALAAITDLVAHEFNNALNGIVLQVAVLDQLGVTGRLKDELAVIRKKAMGAAGMVRQLQHYGQQQQPPAQWVDLNQASRDAVAGLSLRVQLDLASGLPPVLAIVPDLKRMVEALVESAAAAAAPGTPAITLRTRQEEDRVLLEVEDTAPDVEDELLARLFEPFVPARPGDEHGMRLALCKGLARRFQAVIRGENRDEGGMRFTVEFRSDQ